MRGRLVASLVLVLGDPGIRLSQTTYNGYLGKR